MPTMTTNNEERILDLLVKLVDGDFKLVHKTTKRLRLEYGRTPMLSELVKELMLIIAQKPVTSHEIN